MSAYATVVLGIGKPFGVLTHIHQVEDLMGGDFPVPMSVSVHLAMTLIDGAEEIPFTLRRRGFTWKRNIWKLLDIMGPDQLREWRFHNVRLFATRTRDVTERLLQTANRARSRAATTRSTQ